MTISLPLPDLTFLKEHEERHGLASRSAAFHAAIGVRRGEIWAVDFDPVVGAEADERGRPAGIVSGDGRNKASERTGRGVITVAPLTSNTTRVL